MAGMTKLRTSQGKECVVFHWFLSFEMTFYERVSRAMAPRNNRDKRCFRPLGGLT